MAEIQVVTAPIEKMLETLSVDRVFGQPRKEGEFTVIPVAQVSYGYGYGGGYGRDGHQDRQKDQRSQGSEPFGGESDIEEGGGSGAGGGGRAVPRGYIRITPEGVEFKSIEDGARIPLAGIAMVAWSVFWVAMTIRVITRSIVSVRRAKLKAGK